MRNVLIRLRRVPYLCVPGLLWLGIWVELDFAVSPGFRFKIPVQSVSGLVKTIFQLDLASQISRLTPIVRY